MSTILILGAASDMAVAIAKKYAQQGNAIQLAARGVQRLKALQSDISIRYNTTCTVHEFDAVNFASHQAFFDQLPIKPDITICVFGYLGENETARADWKESERIIHTNYTGAV
jgi:decaprenylphospho-beta-D-erythro-pentofuranosid-2-ulose 2-reductase